MRLSVIASLFLFTACSAHAEPVPYLQKPTVSFRTLPPVVDPHPLNPNVHYVGGYELTVHGTDQFTGLSDLQIFPDGNTLKVEAISDYGAATSFEMKPDGKGGYLDSPVVINVLRDETGAEYQNKDKADSEDIAYDPASHDRYVSFEGVQRVMVYPYPHIWAGLGRTLDLRGLPLFPGNEGMEGLTLIREAAGNALLIGVESGGFWRCELKEGACREVLGPPVPGFLYMMTSLAVLDYDKADHDILALYRYYDPITGPRNVLRLLRLKGDRLERVEDLAKIAPPLPYDNYEGVAAIRTPTGYRLFLICDGLHEEDKPKILIYDWTR